MNKMIKTMKIVKNTGFGLLALIAILVGFVWFKANSLQNTKGEFSYEQLSVEPIGKESYIARPDGTQLRVLDAGTGPTVVLAHGFGGTLRDWNLVQASLLKRGFRVIAFEQRGHNKSKEGSDGIGSKQMAGDYKAVLEQFDVQQAVLVGHSMGGFLAIRFMIDYPEVAKARLKNVLIMASFAGDVAKDNSQNKLQIPLIEKGYINTIFGNKALATVFSASLMGEPYGAVVQTSIDNFKVQNYAKLVPILQAFVNENYYSQLDKIPVSGTILVGTADKTTPSFHSTNLSKGIKGAELKYIEGKGHLLNWEAPERVCEEIQALVEK
jgi:non-heme chloroperoxidase